MNNRTKIMGSRSWLAVSAVLLWVTLSAGTMAGSAVARGWERDFLEDSDFKNPRFLLANLACIDDRLKGSFIFYNESIGPVTLQGTKTDDGRFWPVVRLQVADAENGQWTTLGPEVKGSSITLVVAPKSRVKLLVMMDRFRPYIGSLKLGKVILDNGEATCFELSNLLPPPKLGVIGVSQQMLTAAGDSDRERIARGGPLR